MKGREGRGVGNGGEGRGRGRGGEGKGTGAPPPHDLFAQRPCEQESSGSVGAG